MDPILRIVLNLVFTTHQEVERDGKIWLVANGVPLVEGVLNGHLVTMDEFGAFVHDWNDIALVVHHPSANDGSAKVPNADVQKVGRFYNATLDPSRRALKGEFWFDKNELVSSDEGQIIYNKILANTMIEVSTGYYAQTELRIGKFKQQTFIGIHRNIHPDHIAVLPNEIGACSLNDGCGINRNSSELSHNCDQCQAKQNKPETQVDEVEVIKPALALQIHKKESVMEKILEMIANALGKGKRKFTVTKNTSGDAESFELVVHDDPAQSYTLPPSLQALDAFITKLGGVEQLESLLASLPKLEAIANSLENQDKVKREALIAELVANATLGMTAEMLASIPTPALEKMSSGFKVAPKGRTNFSALGLPVVQNADETNEATIQERPSFLRKNKQEKQTA